MKHAWWKQLIHWTLWCQKTCICPAAIETTTDVLYFKCNRNNRSFDILDVPFAADAAISKIDGNFHIKG